MKDTVEVKVHISTGYVGSKRVEVIEIDRDEWELMSDLEKEAYCFEYIMNYVDWGWSEL